MLIFLVYSSQRGGQPMQFDLSAEEAKILKHALEVYLSDPREEIVKTEAHTWKRDLHHEEKVVKKILEKLS